MKQVILDYLLRWKWALVGIFLFYFVGAAFAVSNYKPAEFQSPGSWPLHFIFNTDPANIIFFQFIVWLGLMLGFDMQQDIPRVLVTMPVTPKQAGRGLWHASVAAPGLALALLGCLAILLFHGGTSAIPLFESFFTSWAVVALFLGATFGMLTLIPGETGRVVEKMRNLLFVAPVIVSFFIFMLALSKPVARPLMGWVALSYAILSVIGWFRAERMILNRIAFKGNIPSFQAAG